MGRRAPDPASGGKDGGTGAGEHSTATGEPHALPQADYETIYARVPRLTVELVIVSSDGVLLTRRQSGPCAGLWHIPGGTVRYGEPLTDALLRVAFQELGIEVLVEGLLGYIEYPSHLERGLDWPVGIAFKLRVAQTSRARLEAGDESVAWFTTLPDEMHEEQKDFLRSHRLVR